METDPLSVFFFIPLQGRYGGLLVSAPGNRHRPHGEGFGVPASSSRSAADISTVAQDVAVAFGRPFRLLHSGCVTSPQVTSSRYMHVLYFIRFVDRGVLFWDSADLQTGGHT